MVRITEDMVKKKSEHNEGCISTLEELSLHQMDIEKIELLDKWCRGLKILYLQSNLISKIENLSRMKQLEYLNLALNNIERIENLEGCECLRKLDLTANFVGELTSIESLKGNVYLNELYLTGNPCQDFPDYRDYVLSTLPHLGKLDGEDVERSVRIRACQNQEAVERGLRESQRKWRERRDEECQIFLRREEERKRRDGIEIELQAKGQEEALERLREEREKEHQEERLPYTPESRIESHRYIKEKKEKEESKKETKEPKKPRPLFKADGNPVNCNEAKVEFELREDMEHNRFELDVGIFKHMDTSLIEVDIQPNYVRVTLKGKILQLRLHENVRVDNSEAQRSQITGRLLIIMPKAKEILGTKNRKNSREGKENPTPSPSGKRGEFDNYADEMRRTTAYLEVSDAPTSKLDYKNILKEQENTKQNQKEMPRWLRQEERPNSPTFVDDPNVPPLE